MKNLILTFILAAGVTLAFDAERLQKQARAASTPSAHAEVARGYQQWADTLDAKAAKHEANVQRMAGDNGYNPIRHKWPAMAAAPAERERRLALQARRAANEARALALKHESLAAARLAEVE